MKEVFLRTMGCQMNDHDSEVIKGLLLPWATTRRKRLKRPI